MFEIATVLIVVAALFSFMNYRYLRLPNTIGVMLIALVLSLADQVYGLRGELRKLVEAVEREPAEVQARIRAAAQTLSRE